MKQFLNTNDVLTKVEKYVLERGDSQVFIDIHEIVADALEEPSTFKFMGIPNQLVGGTNPKYVSTGNSAEEVLAKCLQQLQDSDLSDIRDPYLSNKGEQM